MRVTFNKLLVSFVILCTMLNSISSFYIDFNERVRRSTNADPRYGRWQNLAGEPVVYYTIDANYRMCFFCRKL